MKMKENPRFRSGIKYVIEIQTGGLANLPKGESAQEFIEEGIAVSKLEDDEIAEMSLQCLLIQILGHSYVENKKSFFITLRRIFALCIENPIVASTPSATIMPFLSKLLKDLTLNDRESAIELLLGFGRLVQEFDKMEFWLGTQTKNFEDFFSFFNPDSSSFRDLKTRISPKK